MDIEIARSRRRSLLAQEFSYQVRQDSEPSDQDQSGAFEGLVIEEKTSIPSVDTRRRSIFRASDPSADQPNPLLRRKRDSVCRIIQDESHEIENINVPLVTPENRKRVGSGERSVYEELKLTRRLSMANPESQSFEHCIERHMSYAEPSGELQDLLNLDFKPVIPESSPVSTEDSFTTLATDTNTSE